MNCKHLSKISVLYTNASLLQSSEHLQVLTRQLGKSSNPSRQHEFQVSKRKSDFPKNTIQAKPLPSQSEVWNRVGSSLDNCKHSDLKFLTHTPSYKYEQRRNLSSLLEKIKNFLMSAFSSNSIPLLKPGKPVELKKDEANKLKASVPSPTATPSKSISLPSLLQSLKSKPKEKTVGQKTIVESSQKKTEAAIEKSRLQELENEIKIKKSFGTGIGITADPELQDKKPDLVADSLMKETAQRLEVENKRKPPFGAGKGSFAEDRIATEMPRKRREKIELEQELIERRAEEAEDADDYKVIDEDKRKPPLRVRKSSFAEDRIATKMAKKRREKIELEREMKERRVEEAEDADDYKVIDEDKRKPPLRMRRKSSFAEDRIATETPKRRRKKVELEQEMKERRVEEVEDADDYKVIDDAKQKPKKASTAVKKMDASKLCDHDDVFCGVEQFDDTKGVKAQKHEAQATQVIAAKETKEMEKKTKAMAKKSTQIFTSRGQVKPTGLVPKRRKGFEKNYSTSAITLEANRISPKDFSIGLSEVSAFKHYDENFALTASILKRLSFEDFHQIIANTNSKSKDIADRTPKIIQRDPLETFEQKEPKPVVEVKEPAANSIDLIEPINRQPFEDPFCETPLIAESKRIAYGRDAKEEVKKEDEKRKEERKAACKEENRSKVIEEPCSQNKPLCCYNPPKRQLETDLTDKCNAKCSVAPQAPPPVMDCSLCKRYETLKEDVPKPKPMVCKVSKCSKPTQECPPSDGPKGAKLPKRSELCGSSCATSKRDCDSGKEKAEMSSCPKPKCGQKTCPRKGKPKPVVCPSMPKACMSKPKEKKGTECKTKTCPTINAASRMEEAKKKEKEAEKRKEREKKCNPKKKKAIITLSECDKKKLKAEEDKRRAEEEAKNAADPKVHTEWKAVPIKGSGRWCDKEGGKQDRAEPTSKTVTPNMEKKYQSPRYDKKPVCDDKKSTDDDEPKGTKKCIPIGILDISQSLGTIENSLYLGNVLSESDDGSDGGRNKKSPEVPPPILVEKSKSDSKAIPFHFDDN